ncbi:MAG: hypothetical protein QW572_05350 [Candidatus Nitrosocaldus sp.]
MLLSSLENKIEMHEEHALMLKRELVLIKEIIDDDGSYNHVL